MHGRLEARTARVLLWSGLIFFSMAAIGTLTHELGHILVAQLLGYRTTLHFGSMSWWPAPEQTIPAAHDVLIALGGPSMDAAIGTTGLLWLALLRSRTARWSPLGLRGWMALTMAFFWSRQVFNVGRTLVALALEGDWRASDEAYLASVMGLHPGLVLGGMGVIGLVLCGIAVFRFVPRWMVVPFLTGAAVGGLAGFAAWHTWAGPILLPV